MKVKMVIIAPEVQPNEFMLALPTKIGRGHEATLKLVHPLISRVHCEFYEQDGALMIRDLDSLNGTFVNQDRITEDTPLESNATVVIGSVMVRLLIGDDADRMPPARGEMVAGSAETLRQETLQKISKGGETVSDDELWESTEEEPEQGDDATVDLKFEDEEDEEAKPQAAPKPQPQKQADPPTAAAPAKPAAPAKSAAPAKPAPAKPAAPQKPAGPAPNDSSDFIMPPLDEPSESPGKQGGGEDDDFWKSIM